MKLFLPREFLDAEDSVLVAGDEVALCDQHVVDVRMHVLWVQVLPVDWIQVKGHLVLKRKK